MAAGTIDKSLKLERCVANGCMNINVDEVVRVCGQRGIPADGYLEKFVYLDNIGLSVDLLDLFIGMVATVV
jgi:hypothetical protein